MLDELILIFFVQWLIHCYCIIQNQFQSVVELLYNKLMMSMLVLVVQAIELSWHHKPNCMYLNDDNAVLEVLLLLRFHNLHMNSLHHDDVAALLHFDRLYKRHQLDIHHCQLCIYRKRNDLFIQH